MKDSQIKNRLKSESEANTPDVYDNVVRTAQSEGLFEAEETTVEVELNGGAAAIRAKNKGRLTATVVSVCAVFLACIIALVALLVIKSPDSGSGPVNIKLSTDNAYGVGAVSTVKLLGGNVSAQSLSKLSAVRTVATADKDVQNTDVKDQIEKFNEYFTALDDFIGGNPVSTQTVNNTDAEYPYETKMTIMGVELGGNTVEYVMYYTETLKTHSDSYSHDTEYTLEGIMLIDGEEYYLTGERKEENEHDEKESKIKIRAYSDRSDRGTYVEMEQEQSEEENESEVEYVYSVYSNGKLVEMTAVEFESEVKNGKEEIEYELEFRSGTSKGKYKVERETKRNTPKIKVSYSLDGSKGEFEIRMTADGNYEYKFSDGSSKILKK